MFDFFKDILLESQGIDSEQARKQKEEEKEIKKLGKYIFSIKAKWLIGVCAIIYLFVAGASLKVGLSTIGVLNIIKYMLLGSISITVLILLFIKNKKSELVILVLIIGFVILNYLSLFLN